VPEHIWKDVNPEQDVIEEPIGTGAFVLGDYKPQAFTYSANPDYWGGEPALENIRFVALSGNQAGADGIAAGTIDWQTGPIPDIQNTNQNFPNYDHFTQWQSQMVLATCSSAELGCEGPQTDPAVRQAIYYAIDRTQLNSLAFEETAGEVSPTFALTPNQDAFISDAITEKIAPMSPDIDKAAELLEAAGWVKGDDGIYAKDGERLSLTIEVVTGWTDYITALDVLGSQAKAAGIELNAAQSSWNEWTDKKVNGNFELAIDSLWQGPVSDPYYVYNYFFDSGSGAKVGEAAGNNYSRFSSPTVDGALAELATMPLDDAAARQPYFDTIQAEIVDVMPYIPVLTGGTTSIWNIAEFSGWPTEDDLYAFPAVWSAFDAAEIFKRLEPQG
jgi:peptide/nickel transport system substrate-binding protein